MKDMSSMYGSVLDTEETATEAIMADDQQQQKKKKTNRKTCLKRYHGFGSQRAA